MNSWVPKALGSVARRPADWLSDQLAAAAGPY